MRKAVEDPLIESFSGRKEELRERALAPGALPMSANEGSADV